MLMAPEIFYSVCELDRCMLPPVLQDVILLSKRNKDWSSTEAPATAEWQERQHTALTGRSAHPSCQWWHPGTQVNAVAGPKGPTTSNQSTHSPARTAFPEAAKADGNHGANQLSKCCFSCLSAVNWTILAAWQQGSATAPDMGG